MLSIKDLRRNADKSREYYEEKRQQKVDRARQAALEVVQSSAFEISCRNNPDKSCEEFAEAVAASVAEAVTNPQIEFLDICTKRGLKPEDVKEAVLNINRLYGVIYSDDYDTILSAVAQYIQLNPELYDKIVLLNNPREKFLQECDRRGLKPSETRRVVAVINQAYELTDSQDYDTVLNAVAAYVQDNPSILDDIAGV